jgi:hypothetical protein
VTGAGTTGAGAGAVSAGGGVSCAGSSATLTGNGASTYNWNPGAIALTTIAVTPTVTTVYTVTGTSATDIIALK